MAGIFLDGIFIVDGVADIPIPGYPIKRQTDCPSDAAAPAVLPDFLAGPENRLVEVAVHSVLGSSPNGYNPVVIYGASGTGKSHLARGLAAAWKTANPRRRAVCSSAVDFARQLREDVQAQATDEFRRKHRKAGLLVVEDVGTLAVKKAGRQSEKQMAQEELLSTLDALLAGGRWAVVTASAAPAELPGLLPALRSRLMGGLTVPLQLPGPATRLAVLRRVAQQRELELSEPVAHLLAESLPVTIPELNGALIQLEMAVKVRRSRITPETVRRFLAERSGTRQTSLDEVARATARYFSLTLTELRSSSRRRALVTARGVAMYLARQLTGESLHQIGRYFGNRDHTTVMHGCRKTEELVKSDPAIREAVVQLQQQCQKQCQSKPTPRSRRRRA